MTTVSFAMAAANGKDEKVAQSAEIKHLRLLLQARPYKKETVSEALTRFTSETHPPKSSQADPLWTAVLDLLLDEIPRHFNDDRIDLMAWTSKIADGAPTKDLDRTVSVFVANSRDDLYDLLALTKGFLSRASEKSQKELKDYETFRAEELGRRICRNLRKSANKNELGNFKEEGAALANDYGRALRFLGDQGGDYLSHPQGQKMLGVAYFAMKEWKSASATSGMIDDLWTLTARFNRDPELFVRQKVEGPAGLKSLLTDQEINRPAFAYLVGTLEDSKSTDAQLKAAALMISNASVGPPWASEAFVQIKKRAATATSGESKKVFELSSQILTDRLQDAVISSLDMSKVPQLIKELDASSSVGREKAYQQLLAVNEKDRQELVKKLKSFERYQLTPEQDSRFDQLLGQLDYTPLTLESVCQESSSRSEI